MKKALLIIIVVGVVGGGAYYFFRDRLPEGIFNSSPKTAVQETYPEDSGATEEAIAEISKYQYTETFVHPELKFAFRYPSDFSVERLPLEGSEAILVHNKTTQIGAQIYISPYSGSEINITPELVSQELPELQINEPQEVLIGTDRKGLAFLSDNKQFGGSSREVWFVWDGLLYQISTYAELDEFLKGLFGTWAFQ